MLSGAKHLLYPIEKQQKQILRYAQDDIVGDFFINLLDEQAAEKVHR